MPYSMYVYTERNTKRMHEYVNMEPVPNVQVLRNVMHDRKIKN